MMNACDSQNTLQWVHSIRHEPIDKEKPPLENLNYTKETYTLRQFFHDEREHRVWAESSVKNEDIMGMLLAGYRQPKIANDEV
jgi:hypothetical protein